MHMFSGFFNSPDHIGMLDWIVPLVLLLLGFAKGVAAWMWRRGRVLARRIAAFPPGALDLLAAGKANQTLEVSRKLIETVQRIGNEKHSEKVNALLDGVAPTLAEIQRLMDKVQAWHNDTRRQHAPPELASLAARNQAPVSMTSSEAPEPTAAAGPMCEPDPAPVCLPGADA